MVRDKNMNVQWIRDYIKATFLDGCSVLRCGRRQPLDGDQAGNISTNIKYTRSQNEKLEKLAFCVLNEAGLSESYI